MRKFLVLMGAVAVVLVTATFIRSLDEPADDGRPCLALMVTGNWSYDGDTWTSEHGRVIGYSREEDTTIWNKKECQ